MRNEHGSSGGPFRVALPVALSLLCGAVATAQGSGPAQLRRFIDQQVGGIEKLMVPAHDADLPQPRLANGSLDPQFLGLDHVRDRVRGGRDQCGDAEALVLDGDEPPYAHA